MSENYAYITYPGIETFESCSVSFQHGIAPGTINLTIPQQNLAKIPLTGEFSIFYNGKKQATFSNCLVDAAVTSFGSTGNTVQVVLKDFRWTWVFGNVTGRYNTKDELGKVKVKDKNSDNVLLNPEKTPRELLEILLDALGVTDYDVSEVPDEQRPEVNWNNAKAANELGKLCEKLGVSVVPSPNGRVVIAPLGIGRLGVRSFNKFLIEQTAQINPPELPKSIKVISAPIRYQRSLELRPVLKENFFQPQYNFDQYVDYDDSNWYPFADGTFPQTMKSIAPPALHEKTGANLHNDVETYKRYEHLLNTQVYRYYQIDRRSTSNQHAISGLDGPIDDLLQIELQDTLIMDSTGEWLPSSFPGAKRTAEMLKHSVWGSFLSSSAGDQNNIEINDAKSSNNFLPSTLKIHGSYSVNKKSRLVTTGKKIFRRSQTKQFEIEPAQLFIYASFFLRNKTDGDYDRLVEDFEVNPNGGGTLTVVREDLKPAMMECGFRKSDPDDEEADNFDVIKEEMKQVAEDLMSKYKMEAGSTNIYVGIIPIILNGRIVSVNYQINQGGSITTINIDSDVGTNIAAGSRKASEEFVQAQDTKRANLNVELREIFSPLESALESDGVDA